MDEAIQLSAISLSAERSLRKTAHVKPDISPSRVHSRELKAVELKPTAQYLGIAGSMRSAQRLMPPARLRTFLKPAREGTGPPWRFAPPLLQCTTISSAVESSLTLCGKRAEWDLHRLRESGDRDLMRLAHVDQHEIRAAIAQSLELLDRDFGNPGSRGCRLRRDAAKAS